MAQHPELVTDLKFEHQQPVPEYPAQVEHETEVLQDCALARYDKDPMMSATAKNLMLNMKFNQAPTKAPARADSILCSKWRRRALLAVAR